MAQNDPSYRQSFRLLATYARPQWARVLLLLVLLLSAILFQLLQPQILRDFIDLATGEISVMRIGGLTSLAAGAGLFILFAVLNQLLRAGSAWVTQDVRWRTTNALRADLAQHALGLDMGYHNNRTAGELISRIDEDVNVLSNFFSQFIIQVFGNGLLILGIIVVLFREDPRIGYGYLGFVIITGAILRYVIRLAIPHFRKFFAMGARLFAFIEERLAGTEDIRANGGGPYTMLRLFQTLRAQYEVEQTAFALGTLTFATTQGLFNIGTALGLGLGAYLYQLDVVTIGTVYLIVNYSAILQEPLRLLTQQLQDFQRAVAAVARIQELYFTTSTLAISADTTNTPLTTGPIQVNFDQVDFHYAADTPVLRDLSFNVKATHVLGLLGRTGSGKTTVTRLIFRLYDTIQGSIRLNGNDLRNIPIDNLRKHIGIVTQDVQLFNASVRDNLTFFNDDISDQQILQALETLGLQKWLAALPKGLDTVIEAGGRGLSAGEAQLLAFTRIFLKDPGLIILDEASSRLDPATEALIERAIDKLLHNRTAIIIAHRLATVQRADHILILEQGAVKEYGKRTALVANPNSTFSQLLKTGLEEVLA